MPNSVALHPKAEKFLRKLRDEKLYHRLMESILELETYIFPRNSKKLVNFSSDYRLRVGDYRILYNVEGSNITVTQIVHRKDAYS